MVEINEERPKRPRLKRLFLISAGVGLGLAVGIVAMVAVMVVLSHLAKKALHEATGDSPAARNG